MSTFDPERMRIMGHALRIIGTFLGNYRRYFENLRIALWAKNWNNLPTPNERSPYCRDSSIAH